MSKNEFKEKLERIRKEVDELRVNQGVLYDSALYALLLAALYCIESAASHANELKEMNP